MKVIDLLQRIANKKDIPKVIRLYEKIFIFNGNDYRYINNEKKLCNFIEYIGFYTNDVLNDEIEILDEDYIENIPKEDTSKENKKIEKLNEYVDIGSFTNQIGIEDNLGFVHWSNDLKEGLDKQTNFNKNVLYKINEIIDKINGDSNE